MLQQSRSRTRKKKEHQMCLFFFGNRTEKSLRANHLKNVKDGEEGASGFTGIGPNSLADCWNTRATGNPNSRQFLRQPPVRQIISIGHSGQKHCEDHSTLGNCKSTKARGICVTPPHTHAHLHPLSSPSLQCVAT